ncbi:hypothetical protein HB364_12495 [Pseudoflavitalea sp. X16]|uniref:hypothetical protein n=1 Tax=Paraflavitalea devenefica TaxID=2716334 RepID=UPI00141D9577|nr:hypothetical protein [Paraflavitalea devenefica]NII25909.1 hypothetical protein [Paraflavitalea devenefica]
MAYHQPFQITGFHSCDRDLGLRLLNGSDELRLSDNPWDWLGPGVYFWEQNPHRALTYAVEAARKSQKFSGKIKTPFVIGAIIELGNCLNLIEPNSINIVKEAHVNLLATVRESDEIMPVNKGANRQLDCAVIKFVHQSNKNKGVPRYDTIRSPFQEGGPIYDGANFTDRLHIEICVLNTDLIKGYFLPRPVEEFNPYLNKEFEE